MFHPVLTFINNGHKVTISPEDESLYHQYSWNARRNRNAFYLFARINGRERTFHRVLMESLYPDLDGFDVDHEDNNGLNNSRHNLRIATRSQNNMNRRKIFHMEDRYTSHYKGVCFRMGRGNKYTAQIKIDKKQIHLGSFVTEEQAALAYNGAAVKYFGEFALLNNVAGGN